MTAERTVGELERHLLHVPGTCEDHPDLELVPASRLYGPPGWGQHGGFGIPKVCPSPEHGPPIRGYRGVEPPIGALRCRWCGRALYPADAHEWDVNPRKSYDSDAHRLLAFRSRRRGAIGAATSLR